MFKIIKNNIYELLFEIKTITWVKKEEIWQFGWLILIINILISIMLWVLDTIIIFIFSKVMI